jgi:MFS superfamily sulfate permease-like transporter
MASIAGSLPMLHIPSIPLSLNTLSVIFPTALSVAAVGLIETLLTQQLVDNITESKSETHVECIAQGVGNVATGFLGGMGGCAMIGQSMINVNSGGRTRVSGISCSFFLAMSVIAGSSLIEKIPLAALVGTMWMLVIDIFDKSTFKRVFKVPKSDSLVVALVTGITVVTNLAVAVFAGVIVASLSFAWKSAKRISALREVEQDAVYGKQAAIWKVSYLSLR